jgi:SAM-dependent MidA family methyltransferase
MTLFQNEVRFWTLTKLNTLNRNREFEKSMTKSLPSQDALPEPDADARAHSRQLTGLIREEIEAGGGAIPFDRFMELALYAPGLGYYVAGAYKFGEAGDFVTAPEISPLFARCMARQCSQVLSGLNGGDILEFGAGSGILAADLLAELEQLGSLPERYLILEISPDLRSRQQETLQSRVPALAHRVHWLDGLPTEGFTGVVLANEVLDAMAVHRFRITGDGVEEQFIGWSEDGFQAGWGAVLSPGLEAGIADLDQSFDAGYQSEINLRALPWLEALAGFLTAGLILLIDYGYTRTEFYHPQRSSGTLMCHYRHRAHSNPLILVGLQDITAHVDFTTLAMAGEAVGLAVSGYTTQAHFLLGSGLDQIMAASDPNDVASHMDLVQGVRRLTLPTEMGECFKVLALGRGFDAPLIGFAVKDLCERL